MKIIPKRTMFLDGRRVEFGKSEEVSKAAGDLAIRHGWAVEAPDTKKSKADKDAE
ncbi:MAG: hypothetical protein K9J28_07340 [Sulfuritalea sp.]|nr:hypothetical protein [Sulfuritalea sp.]